MLYCRMLDFIMECVIGWSVLMLVILLLEKGISVSNTMLIDSRML